MGQDEHRIIRALGSPWADLLDGDPRLADWMETSAALFEETLRHVLPNLIVHPAAGVAEAVVTANTLGLLTGLRFALKSPDFARDLLDAFERSALGPAVRQQLSSEVAMWGLAPRTRSERLSVTIHDGKCKCPRYPACETHGYAGKQVAVCADHGHMQASDEAIAEYLDEHPDVLADLLARRAADRRN